MTNQQNEPESEDVSSVSFKRMREKIARLELERDAYATAMKIALEDGIFATKETTSHKIKKPLGAILDQEHDATPITSNDTKAGE